MKRLKIKVGTIRTFGDIVRAHIRVVSWETTGGFPVAIMRTIITLPCLPNESQFDLRDRVRDYALRYLDPM